MWRVLQASAGKTATAASWRRRSALRARRSRSFADPVSRHRTRTAARTANASLLLRQGRLSVPEPAEQTTARGASALPDKRRAASTVQLPLNASMSRSVTEFRGPLESLSSLGKLIEVAFRPQSNLEQCGACASAGGIDCTQIAGATAVGCVAGVCEVWACEDGYSFDATAASCVPF